MIGEITGMNRRSEACKHRIIPYGLEKKEDINNQRIIWLGFPKTKKSKIRFSHDH